MNARPGLSEVVRDALVRRIAKGELPEDVVRSLVKNLSDVQERFPIRRFDVCVYGICVDHLIERDRFGEFSHYAVTAFPYPLRKLEVFPWGIPAFDDTLLQVHVELDVSELAGLTRFAEPGP